MALSDEACILLYTAGLAKSVIIKQSGLQLRTNCPVKQTFPIWDNN